MHMSGRLFGYCRKTGFVPGERSSSLSLSLTNEKGSTIFTMVDPFYGAYRDRTDDLLVANQALSQLS